MTRLRRQSTAPPSDVVENPGATPIEEDPHSSVSSFNGEVQLPQDPTETSPLLFFR